MNVEEYCHNLFAHLSTEQIELAIAVWEHDTEKGWIGRWQDLLVDYGLDQVEPAGILNSTELFNEELRRRATGHIAPDS